MSKKICVVTGAGSGIGKASALELLKNNFTVYFLVEIFQNLKTKTAPENSTTVTYMKLM